MKHTQEKTVQDKTDQTNGKPDRKTADPPDPEVRAAKPRRRFTAAYKRRILDEVDSCTEPGEVGALLRREGLYSSYLTRWRKEQRAAQQEALESKKHSRQSDQSNPYSEELERLRRENRRLTERLERAEAIVDTQKKLSDLLGPRERVTRSNGHG